MKIRKGVSGRITTEELKAKRHFKTIDAESRVS